MTDRERFWSHVDKAGPTQPHMTTPCWLWTASTNRGGYGQIRIAGFTVRAHRVAWELAFGAPPAGLCLHECDVRNCVRPNHLYDGTHTNNALDTWARSGRANNFGDAHGELNVNAVLTEDRVLVARILNEKYGLTTTFLAECFGTSQSSMWAAIHRKTWRHVQ